MSLTVKQLAERIGAELIGDNDCFCRQISAVGPIEAANENEVTFVVDKKHKSALSRSHAGAVICSKHLGNIDKPQLIVEKVNEALIDVLNIFAPELKAPTIGVDATAQIAPDVKIAEGASIGANVVIDSGVAIGINSVIGSGCKIGQNSKLGKNCRLDSNVVIYHNCLLGDNIIIQANSTIGSTGFGYSYINNAHRLIPHNGGVIIEDFVEIGPNCCIDRAKFGNTIIGAGTKIDNLVHIAHNVIIGKCCLIAGQCGISGSCNLGDGVVLGGQVGLTDNIEIGKGTMVGGKSGVMNSVPAGKKVMWIPAFDLADALRSMILVKRLPKMAGQLKELSKRLKELEAAEDHKA